MLNPFRRRIAGILIIYGIFVFSCSTTTPYTERIDYRREMKSLIGEIATAARSANPSFEIIVNNGEELVTRRGTSSSSIDPTYREYIDGFLIESLFYGYSGVDSETPLAQRITMLPYLQKIRNSGVPVLVIDYCSTPEYIAESRRRNHSLGFLAYAAPRRELDTIPESPPPVGTASNAGPISSAATNQASQSTINSNTYDFLYLVNPGRYETLEDFESSLKDVDTAIIVIDLYFGGQPVPAETIERIRTEKRAKKVYAYMSVGEASTWRYYWSSVWNLARPKWIGSENPSWPGSFRVDYWSPEWKNLLIYGPFSYLSRILAARFDGVVLDGVDTYQTFEE